MGGGAIVHYVTTGYCMIKNEYHMKQRRAPRLLVPEMGALKFQTNHAYMLSLCARHGKTMLQRLCST